MKQHKHAALIKAWADGAEIQYLGAAESGWMTVPNPTWKGLGEYRIKPHVHQGLIDAYMNGALIQYNYFAGGWSDCPQPCWGGDTEYRIKPEEVVIEGEAVQSGVLFTHRGIHPNLKLTFEDHTLVKAEVIK